jgi:hypothetical protein
MTTDDSNKQSHYEAAASRAVEGHPLPGEDLDTLHLDDADLWISTYTELLAFKEALIEEMNARLTSMPAAAVEEVRRSDALVLEAEAQRFRQRLGKWERRRTELLALETGTGIRPPDESTLLGVGGVEEEVLAEAARARGQLAGDATQPVDDRGAEV